MKNITLERLARALAKARVADTRARKLGASTNAELEIARSCVNSNLGADNVQEFFDRVVEIENSLS